MEKLIGEYSVVKIPEDATKCWLSVGYLGTSLWADKKMDYGDWMESLPTGNYELIGMSDDLNDEQLTGIVERTLNHYTGQLMGWKNYGNEGWEYLDTRRESFQSLLISKGLKGRCAIIKTKQGI